MSSTKSSGNLRKNPITAYTAAQLSALAAAGGLTPYATYIASDTGTWSRATSSRSLAPLDAATYSLMMIGDSLQQGTKSYPLPNQDPNALVGYVVPSLPNIGANIIISVCYSETCPVGAGTLRWYAATSSLSWQAFGQTEGTPINVPTSGFYELPSGSANSQIYISFRNTGLAVVDKADTVTVANSYNSQTADMKGFMGAVMAELNFPFDVIYQYGISGITATQAADASWQWESRYTDVSVIQIGTNETGNLTNAALALAATRRMIVLRKGIGSRVLVVGLFPQNTASAAMAGAKQWYQAGLSALCRELGVAFVDPLPFVCDPASAYGVWLAAYTDDGTHPSVRGSMHMAKYAIAPALAGLIDVTERRSEAAVPWDATTAPYGNLLTNGLLTGTAGTKAARVTGTVPTGWRVSTYSGTLMTVACVAPDDGGAIARTDGIPGNWFEMTFDNSAGVDGESMQLLQTTFIVGSKYSVGDYIVHEVDIELEGAGLKSIKFAATTNAPNTAAHGLISMSSPTIGPIDGVFSTRLRSIPTRIAGVPSNGNLLITAALIAGGTAKMRIARCSIHKVPAP